LNRTLLVILLAILGTTAKGAGWILYGSKTLMVDTFTCIANLAALLAAVYYSRFINKEPDKGHPYGHLRLGLAGNYFVLLSYSFIAGLSLASLVLEGPGEPPGGGAFYSALAGLGFYAPIPLILRGDRSPLGVYGIFTISELLESIIVITVVALSLEASPVFDYIGGYIVLLFVLYELYENSASYITLTTDKAPPPRIVEGIRQAIQGQLGLSVKSLRLRTVYPGVYQGDVVVAVPVNYSIVDAHKIADEVERLGKMLNTDLVVHIEPEEKGG